MKKISVEKAVGMILCHDITQIIPGKFKGPAFRKGHIICQEDIEKLKKIGKEYLYIWEPKEGEIHENEASSRISKALTGENIELGEPVEGKITLKSQTRGLFKVKSKLLYEINFMENITIPCLPNNFKVEKRQGLSGIRIVPLTIQENKIKQIEELCQKKGTVFSVREYKKLKVAIITTGNEVYKRLIKDEFGPLLKEKFSYFGAEFQGQTICPDNIDEIKKAILKFSKQGVDLIALSGGMSVDPDDLTPGAIRESGAKVITYGVPVQPGNMFMLAYSGKTALIGIPGASLFYKNTILDIVLPRIFVGDILTRKDFVKMGEGGFCSTCPVCHYPYCYFGR
ncbi:MAG: molybdopterin-binding protein [Candidatus Caldatribacteriota bacterium]|nr:molybdopterin-binding protein [Candidatus Caldatribacteriota bacterium]